MPSQWIGAIVGKFVVGDGTVVGPPVFQPAKPRLTLKGKPFQTYVTADLKQVNPGKARLFLGLVDLAHPRNEFVIRVSSTVSPSPSAMPKLIFRGKTGLRIITPGRQVTGKPKMTLRGKAVRRNTSSTQQPGKAKLILRGGAITKVGKAGMVPTVPSAGILTPTGVEDFGNLVPTPAYTDGLLVPTVEELV
jgi:hypothetical protein